MARHVYTVAGEALYLEIQDLVPRTPVEMTELVRRIIPKRLPVNQRPDITRRIVKRVIQEAGIFARQHGKELAYPCEKDNHYQVVDRDARPLLKNSRHLGMVERGVRARRRAVDQYTATHTQGMSPRERDLVKLKLARDVAIDNAAAQSDTFSAAQERRIAELEYELARERERNTPPSP